VDFTRELASDSITADSVEQGFLYLKNVGNVELDHGTFTALSADATVGSFLHSVAPDLDLDVQNLEISCRGAAGNDFSSATSLTYSSQETYLKSQQGTNGGAFLVRNDQTVNAQTSVVSASNKVHGCYTAATGGGWTLASTDFSDSDSEYSYTAAVKGGVFYAENSELTLSDIAFTTHEAFQGGVAYLEHPQDTSFADVAGYDTGTGAFQAFQFSDDGSGGVFYIVDELGTFGTYGASTPTLSLDNWQIQLAHAEGNGGFAYVEVAELDVELDTMVFEELQADLSGGGFYAVTWDDVAMNDISVELTQAPDQGSFFYSLSAGSNIDITDSDFSCFAAAYDFADGS